jgi:LysM repeat protein
MNTLTVVRRLRRLTIMVALVVVVTATLLPTVAFASGGHYVVRSGDTLSSIARYYSVTISALMSANGLTNPNLVKVGQHLVIPSAYTAPSCYQWYTVRSGDTMTRVAGYFGVEPYRLASANGLGNAGHIVVGQKLCVPNIYKPAPSSHGHIGANNYVVAAGDTLSAIAVRYGTTVYALCALNGISNPNQIRSGQVLRLR